MAYRILVLGPRIKSVPPEVQVQSPNPWTAREFLGELISDISGTTTKKAL